MKMNSSKSYPIAAYSKTHENNSIMNQKWAIIYLFLDSRKNQFHSITNQQSIRIKHKQSHISIPMLWVAAIKELRLNFCWEIGHQC